MKQLPDQFAMLAAHPNSGVQTLLMVGTRKEIQTSLDKEIPNDLVGIYQVGDYGPCTESFGLEWLSEAALDERGASYELQEGWYRKL